MSKFAKALAVAGLAACGLLTGLGLLARWYPPLDIINNFLPVLAIGALALVFLAVALGSRRLIGAAAILLAVTVALLLSALPGAAPTAPEGSERFLRVVNFNLWRRNDRLEDVASFLAEIDADAVVLEEVHYGERFLDSFRAHYPYRVGDSGMVILSKHPILDDGRIDRPDFPPWSSLRLRWARLDVNGVEVELAGVHLARPSYPALQQQDIAALTEFARSRQGLLIVAGDFNMSPWTDSLKSFTRASELGRYNTFHPTWPMRWRGVALLPFLPIDNVFASRHFARLGVQAGPRLGSDHRPVIADIVLAEPPRPTTK